MGVLNVTPDSFSDGGLYLQPERAIEQGLALVEAGADIVDVGGESTRPGALAPGAAAELDRVLPVLEGLRRESDALLSVDTSEPAVMAAAIAAGVDLLNDVRALTRPGALEIAARGGVAICLMHMQGEPPTMQELPRYGNVVDEVVAFLRGRIAACISAGVPAESLILDPGFGFGKTLEHNLELLRRLDVLVAEGFPVLVGLSRKAMIGELAGNAGHSPAERLGGSLALALAARERGARIVRVHDVQPTVQAFRVMDGIESRT